MSNFTQVDIDDTRLVTWASLGASATGAAYKTGTYNDKTVTIAGTFGGTVTIQGSNNGLTWFTLTDADGVALAVTANTIALIRQHPAWIRCISGAGVSAVIVSIYALEV